MIHNGIEYGLMQAYAEGFDILKNANIEALPPEHRFDLDIADIAEVWRRGSVIPSWLLDLTSSALAENQTLDNYSGFVEDSGEGRWTVNGRDRRSGAGGSADGRALRALPFAQGTHVCGRRSSRRCAQASAATGTAEKARLEGVMHGGR